MVENQREHNMEHEILKLRSGRGPTVRTFRDGM